MRGGRRFATNADRLGIANYFLAGVGLSYFSPTPTHSKVNHMSSNQTTASGTGHTLITGHDRQVMSKRDVDAWNRVKHDLPAQRENSSD